MKNPEEIKEKLTGARQFYAQLSRMGKQLDSPEVKEEAAAFFASIRVLEWVLEEQKEKARS